MRVRVVLATAAAALVVIYLLKTMSGPDVSEAPTEHARTPRTARGESQPVSGAPASLRNVFEYGEGALRAAGPAAAPPVLARPTLPVIAQPEPIPSPLVRLVGVLHRGGKARAALVIAGETNVLAAGESAAGYTVVSIDEDQGVHVRTPDGSTIVLGVAPDQ